MGKENNTGALGDGGVDRAVAAAWSDYTTSTSIAKAVYRAHKATVEARVAKRRFVRAIIAASGVFGEAEVISALESHMRRVPRASGESGAPLKGPSGKPLVGRAVLGGGVIRGAPMD